MRIAMFSQWGDPCYIWYFPKTKEDLIKEWKMARVPIISFRDIRNFWGIIMPMKSYHIDQEYDAVIFYNDHDSTGDHFHHLNFGKEEYYVLTKDEACRLNLHLLPKKYRRYYI